MRGELFADHYSQAKQFYISQTEVEQKHIAKALTFELSKVEAPAIRLRMLSHLRNIDAELAQRVATGLGVEKLPPAAKPARPVLVDIKPSRALSILSNPPGTFAGRKLGVLVTDGADAGMIAALQKAVEAEGAVLEIIGPNVTGVTLSDGEALAVNHTYEGGPSVLFDAVALVVSEEWVDKLGENPAVRDFLADAHAHVKLVGYVDPAREVFAAAGIAELDKGYVALKGAKSAASFIARCRELRFWPREYER
jgi:catalase